MSFLGQRVVPAGALTKVYASTDTDIPEVGQVVWDEDGNAYIFGLGVASCAAGSWVSLDEAAQATLLAADAKGRVGVAMAAITATNKGYFQIFGKTTTAKAATGFADNGNIYATATAGTIDDAVVAGDRVHGAWGRSAVSGGVITAELCFPYVEDIAD